MRIKTTSVSAKPKVTGLSILQGGWLWLLSLWVSCPLLLLLEAMSTYFLYDFSIQHSSKGKLRQTFPRRQKASVACGMETS